MRVGRRAPGVGLLLVFSQEASGEEGGSSPGAETRWDVENGRQRGRAKGMGPIETKK